MDQYSSNLRRENDRLQAELAEVTKERDEAQWRCIEGSAELNALTLQVEQLREALNGMLTHMGMDEDEWNQPTYSKAREALALSTKPAEEIIAAHDAKVIEPYTEKAAVFDALVKAFEGKGRCVGSCRRDKHTVNPDGETVVTVEIVQQYDYVLRVEGHNDFELAIRALIAAPKENSNVR